MQMPHSFVPKPAVAPAHNTSAPGLVLCWVGAVPANQTLLTPWIVEQPGALQAGKTTPTRNTSIPG